MAKWQEGALPVQDDPWTAEGQSREYALLETVRKLLEMQQEEQDEEEELAEGTSCTPQPLILAEDSSMVEEHVVVVAAPSHRRRGMQRPAVPGGPCANCGIQESPQWRRPSGKKIVLCNACGIYFSRHHTLPKRKKGSTASASAMSSGPLTQATALQGALSNPGSMDIGSNDSQGDEEAITAAGPTHHMALLQQVACAAASRPPHMRRPSSNSDASQTDAVDMSPSSHSSPSRSSQDDLTHEDLPAPTAIPAIKAEDGASALSSHPSAQLPVLVPSMPSRKRALHGSSSSASNSTPTVGTSDPSFLAAPPAAAAQAAPPPPFAGHSWGQPHHLVLLQQLHVQQQQQQYLRLLHQQQQEHLHMKQALGGHPNHDLLRIMASLQPHPQLLASQAPDALPHIQHALLLHQQLQYQQHQLQHHPHPAHLAHLSAACSTNLAGLAQHQGLRGGLGMGLAGHHGLLQPQHLAQHQQSQLPAASGMAHAATSRLSSQDGPSTSHGSSSSHMGLLPHSLLQQAQQAHWPLSEGPVRTAAAHHGSAHAQQQGLSAGTAAGSVGGAGVEGGAERQDKCAAAASMPAAQQQEGCMECAPLEPAAKRQQRHGCAGQLEGEASNGLKVIPKYACRGPRSASFDAANGAAHLQQQLSGPAPLLAASTSLTPAAMTVYRPSSCALSDC